MQKKLIATTLMLASGCAAAATDLVAAWSAARGHDPAYQSGMAAAQAASYKPDQGRALWRPTIAAQAGAGYTEMRNETNGATFAAPGIGAMTDARFVTQIDRGRGREFGVVAMQPVWSPQRRAMAAQLDEQGAIGMLQAQAAEQSLLLRVATVYFDLLTAEDALATLRAQKEAVAKTLEIATEFFRVGKTASTDMHEAQAAYDAVLAQEAALGSDVELKRAAFVNLTGVAADGLARPDDGQGVDARLKALRPSQLQPLLDRATANNPGVLVSEAMYRIAQREIDKHRLAAATTVDLVAKYGQQRIDGSFAGADASVAGRSGWVGVQINVPLWTGGMRSAQKGEALALADKARFDVEAARQAATQQMRGAYFGLEAGIAQIGAYRQGLVSAAAKLDATKIGVEVGARTTADLLNAQQAYFGVKAGLLRARYQAMIAALNLAAAGGDLDADRFGQINALLTR